MNQKQEREKLIDKFLLMSFVDKKKECLYILKSLYWVSEVINILWNRVYNIFNEDWTSILIETYILLLDSLYFSKYKQEEKAMENLEKIRESFNVFMEDEKKERLLINQSLDDLLSKLDL